MPILTEEQLVLARQNAARIEKGYGLRELRTRAAAILAEQEQIEVNSRAADRARGQAQEDIDGCNKAIKDREAEIKAAVSVEVATDEEGNPVLDAKKKPTMRYTNEDQRASAFVLGKKGDPELVGLATALNLAKSKLRIADESYDAWKSKLNATVRAYNLVMAETYLAAACIRSLGGYEAEAPQALQEPSTGHAPQPGAQA